MEKFDYKAKIAAYVRKRVKNCTFGTKVLLLENGICVHIYGMEDFYKIEMYDANQKKDATFYEDDYDGCIEDICSAIIDFATSVYKYWYAHFLDDNYKMFGGKFWALIEDWTEPKKEYPWIWHPKEK